MKTNKIEAKGFTLLELLIVIAILAILSVTLVLVLNPAESLRKSRDTQRMSDLATLKTALGLYITTIGSPDLTTSVPDNDLCYIGGTFKNIYYSQTLTDISVADLSGTPGIPFGSVVATTDGLGWLPVNLSAIVGGSPISNLPIDPSNTFANGLSTAALITNDALVYRYACNASNITFELNAKLESVAFTNDDDKAAKDGG
ncbi:MAG: type II secretion system protein, partial [Patescibacteria group bacterium]